MLVPLASSGLPIHPANFYHSLRVYHDRPHLVNKKLNGATTLFFYKINFHSSCKLTELINYTSLTYETNRINQNNGKGCTKESLGNLISDLLLPYDKNMEINEISQETFKNTTGGVVITVKLLLAKNVIDFNSVEVSIFNFDETYVQFLSSSPNDKFKMVAPPFPYKFTLQSGILQLIVDVEDADTPSGEWLADKLFPKILKWSEENDDRVIIESLSLVHVERYFAVYRQLKEKYGKKMVEIWPENTDPLKFVYEDVAIASYLICLWSETNDHVKKPHFVDLGCGNGLLVYILSEEGYPGMGIDVRKRKVWDLYPKSTNLEVKTIVPSDLNLFPQADWIIGNHSDELTPWIPVIAARSSPKTNFFLLPCCCFNFDGTKYRRRNTGISQYLDYMSYIENICSSCGFDTKIDKLRIPSTKRTCLIGRGPRTLSSDEINVNINNLLEIDPRKKAESDLNSNNDAWINNYQARDSKEVVRNCTKLERSFILEIVHKLVKTLLFASHENNVVLPTSRGNWNAGCCLEIGTLVQNLEQHELKRLKNECGGLQTLMRNHRYIFNVEKGRVKLRPPYLKADTTKYVTKPCWFLRNHPDGCLYDENTCGYSHRIEN